MDNKKSHRHWRFWKLVKLFVKCWIECLWFFPGRSSIVFSWLSEHSIKNHSVRRSNRCHLRNLLGSYSCSNKVPQIECLKRIEIYSLTFKKPDVWKQGVNWTMKAPSCLSQLLVFLGLYRKAPNFISVLYDSSLWVSLCPHLFLYGHQSFM